MGFLDRLLGRRRNYIEVRANYRDLPRDQWSDDEHDHFMRTCTEAEYWAEWERWSRLTYEHPSIARIKRSVHELAREAARDSFPQEFAGLLRIKGDTITELVLLPGTVQGDAHAIFSLGMKPVDRTINGTLHSHPDNHPYPSDADFELFEHEGTIHLILCEPYGPDDWRAYDHTGVPIGLEVIL